jgi:hypothetical protein
MSSSLPVTALASWLLAEALGAYMAKRWVSSGAVRYRRSRPDSMSLPVLVGHAGLNLAGLACWIGFVPTRVPWVGWLAIIFMIPAIGLGVSTVSVWTPYPVRRATADSDQARDRLDVEEHAWRHGTIPDHVLARALEDETAARNLADDLLAHNLAVEASSTERSLRLDPRALVPLAHGVLAIITFVLVTLSAIAAS